MNNTQDNILKRREKILEYIEQNERTTVNKISEALQISAITVRRDIDSLTAEKKIIRFFGGVKAIPPVRPESPPALDTGCFAEHLLANRHPVEHLETIRKIAEAASDFIDNGDVVLINNSMTASYVLEYLGNKSVVVITNSLFPLARNIGPNVKLCFLGGQLLEGRAGVVGGMTTDALSKITATKFIMGVDGIDILSGLTCKTLEESYINQQMIQRTTGKLIVTAEGGKIACKSAFYSGNLSDVSILITDDTADTTELSHLINNGIVVHAVHSVH